MPHLAAAVASRQFDEALGAFEADSLMAEVFEYLKISSWATAEIQNPKRSGALQVLQQRVAILTDVVITGPGPETTGVPIVVGESDRRGFFEIVC